MLGLANLIVSCLFVCLFIYFQVLYNKVFFFFFKVSVWVRCSGDMLNTLATWREEQLHFVENVGRVRWDVGGSVLSSCLRVKC